MNRPSAFTSSPSGIRAGDSIEAGGSISAPGDIEAGRRSGMRSPADQAVQQRIALGNQEIVRRENWKVKLGHALRFQVSSGWDLVDRSRRPDPTDNRPVMPWDHERWIEETETMLSHTDVITPHVRQPRSRRYQLPPHPTSQRDLWHSQGPVASDEGLARRRPHRARRSRGLSAALETESCR